MEKNKCPSCKKKIPANREVCPKCFFLLKPKEEMFKKDNKLKQEEKSEEDN